MISTATALTRAKPSAGCGPKTSQNSEGQHGHGDDGGHEPAGDPVDQRLDGQLGALGRLDHTHDLRQHGLRAHLLSPKAEGARGVDRAADDFGALDLLDRDRLAGQHGLIDIRAAGQHRTVDRNAFAGPDDDHVAGRDLIDRQFDFRSTPFDAGGLGLERHQTANGLAGLALRARFEPAADEDQGDDHRRRLEIEVGGPVRQPLGEECRDGRESPGGGGAEHDQRVHVRRQPDQVRHAFAVEAQTRNGEHEGRQHEADDPPWRHADGVHKPAVGAGNEVQRHLDDEQGKGRGAGDGDGASQAADFGRSRSLLAILAGRFGRGSRLGGVARLGHGLCQGAGVNGAFQNPDGGAFRRQVDVRIEDAGRRLQRALDTADATRARHARDLQFDGAFDRLVAGGTDRLGHRRRRAGAVQLHSRAFGREVDRGAFHAGRGSDGLLDPPDTAGAGHAQHGNVEDSQGRSCHRDGLQNRSPALDEGSSHGKVKDPAKAASHDVAWRRDRS